VNPNRAFVTDRDRARRCRVGATAQIGGTSCRLTAAWRRVTLACGETTLERASCDPKRTSLVRSGRLASPGQAHQRRMFTARAATSNTVIAEIAASVNIIIFTRRVSGITSVGLNAMAFVNETYM
jgi:hypothetical protein